MNIEDMLGMLQMNSVKRGKILFKLTPQEIARFTEIKSRRKAFEFDIKRTKSKIDSDQERLWSDMMDRNNTHGISAQYSEEEGVMYEMVDK